jgi:hypothetical protein
MDRVHDAREATEFLIFKIVAEAPCENTPLSEIRTRLAKIDGLHHLLGPVLGLSGF